MNDLSGLSMPQFRMVDRNGPPEASVCPFFLCAICQEPVYSVPSPEHELDGYVLWWVHHDDDDNRPDQLGPFIVHRRECMHELEQRVEATDDLRWRHPVLSDELGRVLEQLAYNTGHPLGTDRENDPEYPRNAEYVAPYPSRWRAGHYS